MPPKKRGTKRKSSPQTNGSEATNGSTALLPPDRKTWPGWVEMESEPAFFNVMLKEMGVRGIRIQEVLSLDEEMMMFMPQPIHALIFLFRYKDADQAQQEGQTECPEQVWFANQIPDFACASVALLNTINNIKGLHMGNELRDFKDFTKDMDPLLRGDAIDGFDFVKHIHNSFARENDLLIADMHVKEKAAKAKKRKSLAKAKETREMKKAGKAPLSEQSPNITSKPIRSSSRTPKKTAKNRDSASRTSTPLSDPPDSDADFAAPKKSKANGKNHAEPTRKSGRKPKPRQSDFAASAAATAEQEAEEGFHFVAYMPIDGHVWKLDGLDSFPEDLGPIEDGEDWMSIARPVLATRMAMYEGAEIEFNLMAVVHDPAMKQRQELLENVKELQAIEKKLDGLVEDWREMEGAETKRETIVASSVEFRVSQANVDAVELAASVSEKIKEMEDLMELIERRKRVIADQAPLRGGIRDALVSANEDDEKARHRRHDYGSFVRGWLGALAEEEALSGLLDGS